MLFYEGLLGMIPILCHGGIDFKDGPLFVALQAKTQAKEVGIPICDGATTRNAPGKTPLCCFLTFSHFPDFSFIIITCFSLMLFILS